jgi:hypothetical protein
VLARQLALEFCPPPATCTRGSLLVAMEELSISASFGKVNEGNNAVFVPLSHIDQFWQSSW